MNKFKKLRRNKKGFTLVEIIVVLLILAILAAIAIPSMLGYVEEARNSEYIAKARTGYVAAQTIATKEYVKDDSVAIADLQTTTAIAAMNNYIGSDLVESIDSVTFGEKGLITVIKLTMTDEGGSKTVEINSIDKTAVLIP